ncbi:MAG: hypothetical protein ACK4N5_08740, partial [Myxococcales bacterium]
AYYDRTNMDLKYAYFDGAVFRVLVVESNGNVGWNPTLILDANDNPHISYYDVGAKALKYAH